MQEQDNLKLSREDRLRLLSLGIGKGFFDNEIEMIKGKENLDDRQEALFNHFQIRFNILGFCTPNNYLPKSYYPENIHLKFKFYDFDEVTTARACFFDAESQFKARKLGPYKQYILR